MWIELRDPPWEADHFQRMMNMDLVEKMCKGHRTMNAQTYDTIEFSTGVSLYIEYFTEQFARDQRYDQIIRALRSK